MAGKTYIKNHIEHLQSDILFEKVLSNLPNDNEIIYEPKGIFNKGILNDIQRVSLKKKHLFVEVNRPGIYDTLPKGLFHNKFDDLNNQDTFYYQVEKERKTARRFLLPFDSEILALHSKIERIAQNHFKESFDPDIAIAFIGFFKIMDGIDFLSLIEILAIDRVLSSQIHNIDEDLLYEDLKNILHQDITPYQLLKKLFKLTRGNSKIIRLLNVIPYAPDGAGKTPKIQELLQYLIKQQVIITRSKKYRKFEAVACKPKNIIDSNLNTNAQSLILGGCFDDEVETIDIKIEIDKDNMFLMSTFMNGAIHKLIKTFLSFFLDFSVDYQISFYIKKEDIQPPQTHFSLDTVPEEKIEKMKILKSKLCKHFNGINLQSTSFDSNIPVSTILLLKEYFITFTKLIIIDNNKYTYLSLNTKI